MKILNPIPKQISLCSQASKSCPIPYPIKEIPMKNDETISSQFGKNLCAKRFCNLAAVANVILA